MVRHLRMVSARRCAVAGLLFLLAAAPLAAQEQPPASSLKATLLRLSAAQGIEILGADQLGDEPSPSPSLPFSAGMLRLLLEDYSYALEFAPAQGPKAEPRLRRIHIIGRAGKPAPGPLQDARDKPVVPAPGNRTSPLASPLVANLHATDPLSAFGPAVRRGGAPGAGAGAAPGPVRR